MFLLFMNDQEEDCLEQSMVAFLILAALNFICVRELHWNIMGRGLFNTESPGMYPKAWRFIGRKQR